MIEGLKCSQRRATYLSPTFYGIMVKDQQQMLHCVLEKREIAMSIPNKVSVAEQEFGRQLHGRKAENKNISTKSETEKLEKSGPREDVEVLC